MEKAINKDKGLLFRGYICGYIICGVMKGVTLEKDFFRAETDSFPSKAK